ncbi:hypothetical protein BHE74_00009367 [Ensete ventricosum]|nr:hypothetical protein BHE74_00009367 [Ensete ventricosum]
MWPSACRVEGGRLTMFNGCDAFDQTANMTLHRATLSSVSKVTDVAIDVVLKLMCRGRLIRTTWPLACRAEGGRTVVFNGCATFGQTVGIALRRATLSSVSRISINETCDREYNA